MLIILAAISLVNSVSIFRSDVVSKKIYASGVYGAVFERSTEGDIAVFDNPNTMGILSQLYFSKRYNVVSGINGFRVFIEKLRTAGSYGCLAVIDDYDMMINIKNYCNSSQYFHVSGSYRAGNSYLLRIMID